MGSNIISCLTVLQLGIFSRVSTKWGKYKWSRAAAVAVVEKTYNERGSPWGLKGALSARAHQVLNCGFWGTPVGMGACEVVIVVDYSKGLFCVVVIQDQGSVCWGKPFAEQMLSFISQCIYLIYLSLLQSYSLYLIIVYLSHYYL